MHTPFPVADFYRGSHRRCFCWRGCCSFGRFALILKICSGGLVDKGDPRRVPLGAFATLLHLPGGIRPLPPICMECIFSRCAFTFWPIFSLASGLSEMRSTFLCSCCSSIYAIPFSSY